MTRSNEKCGKLIVAIVVNDIGGLGAGPVGHIAIVIMLTNKVTDPALPVVSAKARKPQALQPFKDLYVIR